MISLENYEEYMILHADGELQPAEEQELMAFLDAHPELKAEMTAYDLTRLSPDENIIYPEKEALLKKETKRTIILPHWRKYAIAAGIAALMCISFFTYREMNKNAVEMANVGGGKTSLPTSKNDTQLHNPKPQQEPQNIAIAPVQPTNLGRAIIHQAPHAVAKHNKQSIATKQEDGAVANNTTTITNTNTEISSLSTTHTNPLPAEITPTVPSIASIPAYQISASDRPAKRSFIDRLPIDEANKRQLKTIAHITSGATRGVSKVKEELGQNAITLNINNNIRISL